MSREMTGSYWELAGIVGRVVFLIVAYGFFTFSCLTDRHGLAIFWGVMLLITEIRAVVEAVES